VYVQKRHTGQAQEPNVLAAECQAHIAIPPIETDLNVMPRDNLCVLDAADPDLTYKLVNAAVHGLAVLLKNTERFAPPNRLVEILLERDFLHDRHSNRDFIKLDERDIFISPLFRLILHANTPIGLSYRANSRDA
jgi:hypothetical protein